MSAFPASPRVATGPGGDPAAAAALTTDEVVREPVVCCDHCGAVLRSRWVDVAPNGTAEPRWRLDGRWCDTSGCPG
jgi:hypothetical protein